MTNTEVFIILVYLSFSTLFLCYLIRLVYTYLLTFSKDFNTSLKALFRHHHDIISLGFVLGVFYSGFVFLNSVIFHTPLLTFGVVECLCDTSINFETQTFNKCDVEARTTAPVATVVINGDLYTVVNLQGEVLAYNSNTSSYPFYGWDSKGVLRPHFNLDNVYIDEDGSLKRHHVSDSAPFPEERPASDHVGRFLKFLKSYFVPERLVYVERPIPTSVSEASLSPSASERSLSPSASERSLSPSASERSLSPSASERSLSPSASERSLLFEENKVPLPPVENKALLPTPAKVNQVLLPNVKKELVLAKDQWGIPTDDDAQALSPRACILLGNDGNVISFQGVIDHGNEVYKFNIGKEGLDRPQHIYPVNLPYLKYYGTEPVTGGGKLVFTDGHLFRNFPSQEDYLKDVKSYAHDCASKISNKGPDKARFNLCGHFLVKAEKANYDLLVRCSEVGYANLSNQDLSSINEVQQWLMQEASPNPKLDASINTKFDEVYSTAKKVDHYEDLSSTLETKLGENTRVAALRMYNKGQPFKLTPVDQAKHATVDDLLKASVIKYKNNR